MVTARNCDAAVKKKRRHGLALKYVLIIDDTSIYEHILDRDRTEFDPLYEITFIGRESAKHLLESNH